MYIFQNFKDLDKTTLMSAEIKIDDQLYCSKPRFITGVQYPKELLGLMEVLLWLEVLVRLDMQKI